MSKTVLAELVTKMTVESAQFKRELDKTTAKSVRFGASQVKAANDSNRLATSQIKTAGTSDRLASSFRRAATSAAILSGPMGGISSRLGGIATSFAAIGVAGTAAALVIAGVAFAAVSSLGAFSRLEQGMLRTEALFKSTGGASGKTADELEALSRSVALATLASVDGVRQAVNILQTFKSIQIEETFDRTIMLSQDLAAVMGTDIKSSALQLGKALENPIKGLSALSRSGVSFSNSQKEVIKNLVETGQTAAAQVMILDTLERQVGGAGSAEAGGLAGASDTLAQNWSHLLENFAKTTGVGETATYALNRIASGMANVAKGSVATISASEKLAALLKEYREIQAGGGFSSGASRARDAARIEAIRLEIAAINAKTIAESEIFKKGAVARRTATLEAAKDLADKNNTIGLTALTAIERQFANENEIVMINHQKRLAAIAALNLSETEIRKRGFETIGELQDYNIGLANEKSEAEFAAIKARNDKIVNAEINKNNRINQANAKAFSTLQNTLAAENNPAELARQQMQARLDVIREFHGLESIEAAKATDAGIAAVASYKAAISDGGLFGTLSESLEGLQNQMVGTLGQMAVGFGDSEEAAKRLGRTVVTQLTGSMINYGIEQVIAYGKGALASTAAETLKTTAVTSGIATQTIAATAATAKLTVAGVASGIKIAAAMAPAAAATSVATAGAAPAAAAPIALGTIGAIIAALAVGVKVAGSFEGGGYIPNGPRTGGMDGRGGQIAIVHPNESIVDHNIKGNSSGVPQNIVMNFSPVLHGVNDRDIIPLLMRNQKKFARAVQSVMNKPM